MNNPFKGWLSGIDWIGLCWLAIFFALLPWKFAVAALMLAGWIVKTKRSPSVER
jgi:hypothetical protein